MSHLQRLKHAVALHFECPINDAEDLASGRRRLSEADERYDGYRLRDLDFESCGLRAL